MKDFALYLLSYLADVKDAIEVTEEETGDGVVNLTIRVDPTDMGRVIGKDGKIISSIRNLLKVRALKEKKLVNVVLAE
jgi:hypothetical protein